MTDAEFAAAGVRPLLRGVLHEVGFAIAIVVSVLVVIGSDGVRRSVAAAAFAGSAVAMLGASALYIVSRGARAYSRGCDGSITPVSTP